MHGSLLLGVATVSVLDLGAQWTAWQFRFPSILLLLVLGFVAGPVTGLLAPEQLQGNWVFTFVAVSVGTILFEGGLSLRLDELRDVNNAVRNLITLGITECSPHSARTTSASTRGFAPAHGRSARRRGARPDRSRRTRAG
jgi:NhaP-type Na+/H+ or K+/H+ antiporter